MDLISIIVPVYNVAPYLDRCVQSLVDQTYPELEILLIDDGSTDTSGVLCDAWAAKDHRIKVIHKPNGGLSDARNAGLKAATGNFISFVDSDDWVHRCFIQYLYDTLISHNADISACEVTLCTDSVADMHDTSNYEIGTYTPEEALKTLIEGRGFRATVWNKLYRYSLLKNETFPLGRFHEDEFFTYRILSKATHLVFLDIPLYYYFQRDTSIMRSIDIRHIDALDAYWQRLIYFREYFPLLYEQDRITFCVSCVNFYINSFALSPDDGIIARNRIKRLRSNLRLTIFDFLSMPFKSAVYAAGSQIDLDRFCKILKKKRAAQ